MNGVKENLMIGKAVSVGSSLVSKRSNRIPISAYPKRLENVCEMSEM